MAHFNLDLAESWSVYEDRASKRTPAEERHHEEMVDELIQDAIRRLDGSRQEMIRVLGEHSSILAQERGWERCGY